MKRFGIGVLLVCLALAGTLVMAGGALAAFPGTNGKIAFVHDPGTASSNTDIVTMDPTGQNRTPLTSTPDDDYDPSWSADGERIVFSRYPTGSPSYGQIWVMNHDGTGQTQLTPGSSTGSDSGPAFSADGKRIAFTRYNSVANSSQIWIMNPDGSGQTQLTFGGPNNDQSRAPSFSPSGQKIVFDRFDGATGYDEIWMMNPDGSGQQRLTTGSASFNAQAPDFSPDGQRIAFDRYDGSQHDLFVMNADGSSPTPVTSGATDDDHAPVFAPDGTRIAFARENLTSTFSNILLVDPTGLNQNLTPLTTNTTLYDYSPDWQPLNPPACDLTGKATSKSVKSVSITVTCPNENATVVAEGSGKAPKVPKAGLAVASKAKKFTIPPVTTQAQAGTPTTITLKIPKKGAKALKKAAKAGKKGKATITATLTDDLGQSSNASFKVKFKAKKKK
jgi:Tol biopolymer transport system component